MSRTAPLNVTIERMTRRRDLTSIVLAYLYAAVLVAGPWIFTVVGLLGLTSASCSAGCEELPVFRSVVIYNSMFALVVTSPLAFLSGRYVSNQLHVGRSQSIFLALAVSLSAFAVITLIVAVPFYVVGTTLSFPARFVAIQNAFLIGVSWLLLPFLGVIRGHNIVLTAFGGNALCTILLGLLFPNASALTLLVIFNVSFTLTDMLLIGSLVRRFGTRIELDPDLLQPAGWKWELPLAGLAYALGIWADKVIMWFGASGSGLKVAGILQTMPSYDTAMFWAQLASIPVIAVAFVHVETSFARLFRRFYGRLEYQASLAELTEAIARLRAFVVSNVAGLFVALGVVATMTILLSFVYMNELGLRPAYMSILRAAVWAMAFHTCAMFCFMFLLYFDLRRPALLTVSTYFVLNASLTVALLPLGQAFYGYGNMIAAAATFLVGFTLLLRELPWLHYHAFVTNNTSL